MIRKYWVFLLMTLVLSLLVCWGCDDDDDDDDNDDEEQKEDPIEEGRRWLKAGVPAKAREAFAVALGQDDQNPEARYGAMTAASMELFSVISLVSVYLADPEDGIGTQATDPNRDIVTEIINILTDDLIGPLVQEVHEHGAWLQNYGEYLFEIEGIPVHLYLQVVAELGSEFDNSERSGSETFAHLFGGFSDTLGSLELDFNLDLVLSIMDVDFGEMEVLEIVSFVVDFIDRLLNDKGYPNFLRIDPDAMDDMAEARLKIGLGCVGLNGTLGVIKGETDPQDDDVLGYQDQNNNDRYDEGEPLVISDVGPLAEDSQKILNAVALVLSDLGIAFLDRTVYDAFPAQDNPFNLASLNILLDAFDTPPIIPSGLTIDIAGGYENMQAYSVRDFLQRLIDLLKPILPEAPGVI